MTNSIPLTARCYRCGDSVVSDGADPVYIIARGLSSIIYAGEIESAELELGTDEAIAVVCHACAVHLSRIRREGKKTKTPVNTPYIACSSCKGLVMDEVPMTLLYRGHPNMRGILPNPPNGVPEAIADEIHDEEVVSAWCQKCGEGICEGLAMATVKEKGGDL